VVRIAQHALGAFSGGGYGVMATASAPTEEIRALYVCYFGVREPLVQTQVLPYLRELTRTGVRVWLLTFEPGGSKRWDAAAIAEWRDRLRNDGIEWSMSTYRKWPSLPAKIVDIVVGTLRTIRIARRERISIIHARSHVATVMALAARRLTRARVVFDIRGLMADEYADVGHWPRRGALYRITKAVERFLYRADAFVVLTERARQELRSLTTGKPVEVIPCCVDMARWQTNFAGDRDDIRKSCGATARTVIVYVGSLGGMYLTAELAEFFRAARAFDSNAFLLVLTQSRPELITDPLARAGVAPADFHTRYVTPEELPSYLAASDIAISLVKPSYAKLASSPTKFAEYLASGLPVISTAGIGDLDEQIERERIGVLLEGFTPAAYANAFRAAEALRKIPSFRDHCIEVAKRLYDLHTVGSPRYLRLYESVLKVDR
jgi:glycosyltransferase involved in cell wall biosynthesis